MVPIYTVVNLLLLHKDLDIGFLYGLLLSICCCLVTKSSDMLNKKPWVQKNCEANQKQQLNDYTCDQNV